jgi:single-strand DNA-binding protein
MIYLKGKIKTRTHEDKTGDRRYVTEVIAESFIMLDKPDKANINEIYTQ